MRVAEFTMFGMVVGNVETSTPGMGRPPYEVFAKCASIGKPDQKAFVHTIDEGYHFVVKSLQVRQFVVKIKYFEAPEPRKNDKSYKSPMELNNRMGEFTVNFPGYDPHKVYGQIFRTHLDNLLEGYVYPFGYGVLDKSGCSKGIQVIHYVKTVDEVVAFIAKHIELPESCIILHDGGYHKPKEATTFFDASGSMSNLKKKRFGGIRSDSGSEGLLVIDEQMPFGKPYAIGSPNALQDSRKFANLVFKLSKNNIVTLDRRRLSITPKEDGYKSFEEMGKKFREELASTGYELFTSDTSDTSEINQTKTQAPLGEKEQGNKMRNYGSYGALIAQAKAQDEFDSQEGVESSIVKEALAAHKAEQRKAVTSEIMDILAQVEANKNGNIARIQQARKVEAACKKALTRIDKATDYAKKTGNFCPVLRILGFNVPDENVPAEFNG